jgi:2-dehydropantoate 2-reductase
MAARSVAVFGAGAVGGYLGGKLARVGDLQVTLIGRANVIDAVRANGLIIREGTTEEVSHPDLALSASGLPPSELVLLTVRTYDVEATIPDLKKLTAGGGVVIAFQNGVGTEEVLAEALGSGRVLVGTLTVSAGMEQPGEVTRYSKVGGVALATMDGRDVPGWIIDAFTATGLPTVTVDDYRSLRWSKLLLNMLAAPTSAILDMDIGEMMAHPGVFRLEQLAFREAARVIDAMGVQTTNLPGYDVRSARLAMRLPHALAQPLVGPRIARARSGRSPGMRGDVRRGRTEVSAYNGAIVRAGKELGVRTPVNETLAGLTQQLTDHPEQRAVYRGRPEALIECLHHAREQTPGR